MDDEMNVQQEQNGTITFANEVLATIAGLAACDIEGVAGMVGSLKDGFTGILGKKNLSKGVKVAVNENVVSVDVRIIVNYGVIVPDVCGNIQRSVKNALETMTGLSVAAVNIMVEGVKVSDSDDGIAAYPRKIKQNNRKNVLYSGA